MMQQTAPTDLALTTQYWCLLPVMGEGQQVVAAREREAAAGCGKLSDTESFFTAGLVTALAWVVVWSALMAWRDSWGDDWKWLLVAVPLVVFWFVLAPFIPIAVSGAAAYFGVRALKRYVDAAPQRKRLREQRDEAERVRLAPIIAEIDRELQ